MAYDISYDQLARWEADLRLLTGRVADSLFTRPEPRATFTDLVRGPLADVPRKNSWQLTEQVGHGSAYRLEWLLGGAKWDADALRDRVRGYVVATLRAEDGVLNADDTSDQEGGQVGRGRHPPGPGGTTPASGPGRTRHSTPPPKPPSSTSWCRGCSRGPLTGRAAQKPAPVRAVARELAVAEGRIYMERSPSTPGTPKYAQGVLYALMWAQYATARASHPIRLKGASRQHKSYQ